MFILRFYHFLLLVVRGEKTRKEFAILLHRHRAAVAIQKQVKSKITRKRFEDVHGATITLQAGITFVILRIMIF